MNVEQPEAKPVKYPLPAVYYVILTCAIGFVLYLAALTAIRYDYAYTGGPEPVRTKNHPLHKAGVGGYVLMTGSAVMGHYGIQQAANAIIAGEKSFGFVVPVGQKVGWMLTGATAAVSFAVLFFIWLRHRWAYYVYLLFLALSIAALALNAFTTVLPNPLPDRYPLPNVEWNVPGTPDTVFLYAIVLAVCAVVFYLVQGRCFRSSMDID